MATTIRLKKSVVRISADGVSDRVLPAPSYAFDAATGQHRFISGGMEARAAHTDIDAAYADDVALTWLNAGSLAYKFVTCLTAD